MNSNITTLANKINTLESKLISFISNENALNTTISTKISVEEKSSSNLQDSINTLQTDISNNTQQLTTLKNQIATATDSIGLIGGLNLADNATTNFGVNGLSSSAYGFAGSSASLEGGKTYTLTVCGNSTQESLDNNQRLTVEIFNSNWSSWGRLDFWELTPTVKQVTIKVPKTEIYSINAYSMNYKPNAKEVTIYWYNIQEGAVGTSWTPSIYDLKSILTSKKEAIE